MKLNSDLPVRPNAATGRQIGQLVYALYGLTDAEIAIVENV